MPHSTTDALSQGLQPVCPRDRSVMRYQSGGIEWKDEAGNGMGRKASYFCGHAGCTVRYTPEQGYFTVVDTPTQPYFVDEPGTNLLRCPDHHTWLYRSKDAERDMFVWRCGIENCDCKRSDSAEA